MLSYLCIPIRSNPAICPGGGFWAIGMVLVTFLLTPSGQASIQTWSGWRALVPNDSDHIDTPFWWCRFLSCQTPGLPIPGYLTWSFLTRKFTANAFCMIFYRVIHAFNPKIKRSETKEFSSQDQPMIQDSSHYMVKISFKLSSFHWNFTRLKQLILFYF